MLANDNSAEIERFIAERFAVQSSAAPGTPRSRALHPFTAAELLRKTFPPRVHQLAPWIPERGSFLIHAPAGLGKTYFMLEVGWAVATGGAFLKWKAPKARKVLFVDGENTCEELQERTRRMVERSGRAPPEEDFFRFIASDAEEYGVANLATEEGQALLEDYIGDAQLVILDNRSTLLRSGLENEAQSWVSVQEWLVEQKRKGRTIGIVHHSNKSGGQRGTSKILDVLDTAIKLSKPEDQQPPRGVRFNLEFEKHQGFTGDAAAAFNVELDAATDVWSFGPIISADEAKVIQLWNEGLSQKDIASEMDRSEPTVSRIVQRLRDQGRIQSRRKESTERSVQDHFDF